MTAHAQDPGIPWVEVREDGVITLGGILESADAQRIDYRQEDLAGCLIRIAQALRRFHELTNVTMIRLGPAAAVEQISLLSAFQTLRGANQLPPRKAAAYPIKGSLFLQLRGIAPGELVRTTISARGRIWRPNYESLDPVVIQVKE